MITTPCEKTRRSIVYVKTGVYVDITFGIYLRCGAHLNINIVLLLVRIDDVKNIICGSLPTSSVAVAAAVAATAACARIPRQRARKTSRGHRCSVICHLLSPEHNHVLNQGYNDGCLPELSQSPLFCRIGFNTQSERSSTYINLLLTLGAFSGIMLSTLVAVSKRHDMYVNTSVCLA